MSQPTPQDGLFPRPDPTPAAPPPDGAWHALLAGQLNLIASQLGLLLGQLNDRFARIDSTLEKIMAVADDIKAAIANLDTETTAIGALITSLAGKIKNSMTDAEVADVKGAFTALSDRLTSLAVDPSAPVPPPPPALQAAKAFAKK